MTTVRPACLLLAAVLISVFISVDVYAAYQEGSADGDGPHDEQQHSYAHNNYYADSAGIWRMQCLQPISYVDNEGTAT